MQEKKKKEVYCTFFILAGINFDLIWDLFTTRNGFIQVRCSSDIVRLPRYHELPRRPYDPMIPSGNGTLDARCTPGTNRMLTTSWGPTTLKHGENFPNLAFINAFDANRILVQPPASFSLTFEFRKLIKD